MEVYYNNDGRGGEGMFWKKPDRTDRNESDGRIFYGYDNDNGTTDWYDKNGDLDSRTKTPYEDED